MQAQRLTDLSDDGLSDGTEVLDLVAVGGRRWEGEQGDKTMMAMVMPNAITPFRELARKIFIQFPHVIKFFTPSVNANTKTSKMISMALFQNFK